MNFVAILKLVIKQNTDFKNFLLLIESKNNKTMRGSEPI